MARAQILVVDDEPLMREFLEETLVRAGYGVVTASDGTLGLREIKSSPYDLVITDIRMPGMDGLALLEEIRNMQPDTVVIVMTAFIAGLDLAFAKGVLWLFG